MCKHTIGKYCVSLFSMYHFCEQHLQELFQYCSQYFTAKVLFCDQISPSEWSIGKVVPVHAQWVFERYGTGLGINTMQGREAKHVHIASYAKHSNIKNRWSLVFRHDYISKNMAPTTTAIASHIPSHKGKSCSHKG